MGDSILDSIKKMLGVAEYDDFDVDIIIHINSAIAILTQLGVGPIKGFVINGSTETYEQFCGSDKTVTSMVKNYLYMKTRLGWDPPTNGTVIANYESAIRELEYRLRVQMENPELGSISIDEYNYTVGGD